MHHRRRFLRFGALLAAALVATSASADTWDEAERAQARKLYLVKCAKCHRLYDPAAYEDPAWEQWMIKMKKKAHLNDEQSERIRRYTETLREGA